MAKHKHQVGDKVKFVGDNDEVLHRGTVVGVVDNKYMDCILVLCNTLLVDDPLGIDHVGRNILTWAHNMWEPDSEIPKDEDIDLFP